jgi:transcription initiation factor TFIID subunit 12
VHAQQQQGQQSSQQPPHQQQTSPGGQQPPSLTPVQQQQPYPQQAAAQHRKQVAKPTADARQTSASRRPSAKTPKSTKTTPQPSAPEARLSLTTKHPQPTLVGPKLQDLVKSIDPNYTMDAEAEEQVLQLADDFLENVTKQALLLAQHRGSKILDVQDIQLVLAKHWGISVPGLGVPTLRPLKPGKANLTVGSTKSSAKRKSTSSAAADAAKKKAALVGTAATVPSESSTADSTPVFL